MADFNERPGRGEAEAPRSSGEPDSRSLQLTLDSLTEARRRRDHGQAAATYATDVSWTRAADATIAELARRGWPFTAEDLRAIVGDPIGSPNAVGARFSAAAKGGVIVPAGFRQATRAEAHGRILRAWVGAA